MKGGKLPRGYTIVEVMIVLSVSGLLFFIAGNFISGKQERTSFQQGSNDFASQMQSIITDVSDGHYTDVHINCAAPPGSATPVSFPVFPASQTDQDNCVFLGKLVHFSSPTNFNQYQVISIAGARLTGSFAGIVPVTLAAGPMPYSNTRLAAIVPAPGVVITKDKTISQNLEVGNNGQSVTVKDSAGTPHYSAYNIGFIEGLGSTGAHAGWYQSGSHTIQMVYLNQNLSGQSGSAAESAISPTTLIPATSATICITDQHRSANIIIGGNNNNQLQVDVKQLGVVSCP